MLTCSSEWFRKQRQPLLYRPQHPKQACSPSQSDSASEALGSKTCQMHIFAVMSDNTTHSKKQGGAACPKPPSKEVLFHNTIVCRVALGGFLVFLAGGLARCRGLPCVVRLVRVSFLLLIMASFVGFGGHGCLLFVWLCFLVCFVQFGLLVSCHKQTLTVWVDCHVCACCASLQRFLWQINGDLPGPELELLR